MNHFLLIFLLVTLTCSGCKVLPKSLLFKSDLAPVDNTDPTPNAPVVDPAPADPTDQYPGALVQSVGTTTTALVSDATAGLEIVGNIATFLNDDETTIAVGNIGVGDVIEYGANYAVIKGLSYNADGAKAYVTLKDGVSAPIATAGANFSIFRAFATLTAWNTQTQNANITPGIALTNKNLTDIGDEAGPLHVAVYNDGALAGGTLDLWTTSAAKYVRIFAPSAAEESINRQRHEGIWSTSHSRLVIANEHGFEVLIPHLRVEGIQCHLTTPTSHRCIHSENTHPLFNPTGVEFRFSSNLLRGANDITSPGWHSGIQLWDISFGEIYIYNNIIYDFIGAGPFDAGIDFDDADFTGVFANNTVYNCSLGFLNFSGNTIFAINNISEAVDPFDGAWNAGSSNNISSLLDAPGVNPLNSTVLTFVNKPGRDLRLAPTDVTAIDSGLDLSAFASLAFDVDGIGFSRPAGVWDRGALENQ